MGMAASQARFLGLTARKTNVEYEGQQVNQQRTALANESSGLFNQMMGLQVPMPPSANNYYNTRYIATNSSDQEFVIMGEEKIAGGAPNEYKIKLQYPVTERRATPNPLSADTPISVDKDGKYTIQFFSGNYDQLDFKYDPTSKDKDYLNDIETLKAIAKVRAGKDVAEDDPLLNPDNWLKFKSSDGKQIFFVHKDDFEKSLVEDADGNKTLGKQISYYQRKDVVVNKTCYVDALFQKDNDEDFTGFRILGENDGNVAWNELPDSAKEALMSLTENWSPLDMKQVNDTEGFDEAMRKYEFDKMKYEKSIQDINSKTEILQQQDRTLELRLKQLDTEQKALSTEMEAVQSVIKKNVETTFKTFA